MRLDAHRIYVDEAYHALFSYELMRKIKVENIASAAFHETTPAFIRRTQEIVESQGPGDRALLELMTVVVSEMLITSTLREASTAPGMDHGVSAMIADHAGDEARHHAFYRHVLIDLWPRLSDVHRNLVLSQIHPLLMAYTSPDEQAIAVELRAAGLPDDQVRQVISETYDPQTVSDYATACGKGIFSTFQELAYPQSLGQISEHFPNPSRLEEIC